MTITLTAEELAQLQRDTANWYNAMTMWVITNMDRNRELMDFGRGSGEAFHKWCKRYQEEHPKPNWKDLLPE